jgi:hypothetical protein
MRKSLALSLSILFLAAVVSAQEPKKPLSPPAKAWVKLGGKSITIDYSAPSKRDRKIMGGLVPYGKVWRTGANAATTLTTEGDIMIGTLHVPAGTYSLYTIPNEKEWTLIVNKQTGQSGTVYDEKQDLGRVALKLRPAKKMVETFKIDLRANNAKSGTLCFQWEKAEAVATVTAH